MHMQSSVRYSHNMRMAGEVDAITGAAHGDAARRGHCLPLTLRHLMGDRPPQPNLPGCQGIACLSVS